MIKLDNINTYKRSDGELVYKLDITAPLYFWNALSSIVAAQYITEHNNFDKEFTKDDFSFDHQYFDSELVYKFISIFNNIRDAYINFDIYKREHRFDDESITKETIKKLLLQTLPLSYIVKRTIILSHKDAVKLIALKRPIELDEFGELFKILKILLKDNEVKNLSSEENNNG